MMEVDLQNCGKLFRLLLKSFQIQNVCRNLWKVFLGPLQYAMNFMYCIFYLLGFLLLYILFLCMDSWGI